MTTTLTEPLYGLPIDPNDFKIGVFLIEVVASNPNGDPDNGGAPRQDINGHGFITPMRLKRMLRSYGRDALSWMLFAEEGVDVTEVQQAHDCDPAKIHAAFHDVRLFGGVLTQVRSTRARCRGPMQFSQARSIAPIDTQDVGITRVFGKIEKGEDGEQDKLRANMGHYSTVPFGLYVGYLFFNPLDAAKVGTTAGDLEGFFHALVESWGADRATQRCGVNMHRLFVVNSAGKRMRLQQQHVSNALSIEYVGDGDIEDATCFEDFKVGFDVSKLPRDVSVHAWESGKVEQQAAAK